jgi:molecular chaperone GrpE (heat shock protein)
MSESILSGDGLPMEHLGLKLEPGNKDDLISASQGSDALNSEVVDPIGKPPESENLSDLSHEKHDVRPAAVEGTSHANPQSGSDKKNFLQVRLNELHHQLENLNHEFQSKLKYDAHKEKIIDALHNELQGYKNDIIKKQMLSVFMDVIKVIDDIRKWLKHYCQQDSGDRDPLKLFKFLESIPSDLEDIFYWQGVKSFTCDGSHFDPTRQRVNRKIETSVKEQDHTIAESIRPGYEWEGKIIRPEMIALYCFNDADIAKAERKEHE